MMHRPCAACCQIVSLHDEIHVEPDGHLCKKCERSAIGRWEVIVMPDGRKFKRMLKRPPAKRPKNVVAMVQERKVVRS